MSTSPYIDIAGVRMLGEVARDLAARGIDFRLAEAHATVRDLVRKEDSGVGSRPPTSGCRIADAIGREP